MSFAATGRLRLNETGETLGPDLVPSELDRMAVRSLGELRLGVDRSVFSIRTLVEGRRTFLAATFVGRTPASIELVLLDGPGRDGVADQNLLKAEHERWLAEIGLMLAPLPFVLDGRVVQPASVGDEHPRHCVQPWGEVVSLIDPKNGGASVTVRYALNR